MESDNKPRQCVEKQRYYSADKGPYIQGYSLPSGHILLWEVDHKEGRMPKNWCLRTVVLEKTTEGPLDSKEIKPVNLKGDQPWTFTGRTDAEAEAPVVWSSDGNKSLEESLMLGKIRRRRRGPQRMDEMAGQHHWCDEHEPGQSLGDGEGQGGLACCSPWGRRQWPSHVPLGDWTTTTRTKWSHRYYAYGGESMFKWIQILSENRLSLFLFQREFRHCLWNMGTNS